jgi:flagellar hook-associated protein 3 FlgL
MTIRLDPNLLPSLLVSIQQTLQNETTASQELSTGRSVNQLSDNPAAAASLVLNNDQSSADDQYIQNAGTLQSKFQTADSTLSNVVTVLTRAISLGTEGANGTLTAGNRQAIAAQVQGLVSQTLALANTAYQGSYLFSGTAVNTQPFTQDPATGAVSYAGNAGTTTVQIANGDRIPGNVPGSQLFQNAAGSVFTALQDLNTSLQAGTTTAIGTAVNELQSALTQLSTTRVTYGNALNQLSLSETFLNQDKLDLSSQENTLIGANPAAAATNFAQAQVANQAVLAATGKVLTLPSLFSYLPPA